MNISSDKRQRKAREDSLLSRTITSKMITSGMGMGMEMEMEMEMAMGEAMAMAMAMAMISKVY